MSQLNIGCNEYSKYFAISKDITCNEMLKRHSLSNIYVTVGDLIFQKRAFSSPAKESINVINL